MKNRKIRIAAACVAALALWLFWPQLFAPAPEDVRWTVLGTNAGATYSKPGQKRGYSTQLIPAGPMRKGAQLVAGDRVRNEGPGDIRLRAPGGNVITFAENPSGSIELVYRVPTLSQRFETLVGAVQDQWRALAEFNVASLRPYFVLPWFESVVLLALVCLVAWRRVVRFAPAWFTARSQRTLISLLAIVTIGQFALGLLGRMVGGFSIYSSAVYPEGLGPAEGLARLHLFTMPVAWVVFLSGLTALCVLAHTYLNEGEDALSERGAGWWLAGGGLCLLIVVAIGAPYLPFVDLYSNTEAYMRSFEGFAAFGAGALFWLYLALLVMPRGRWNGVAAMGLVAILGLANAARNVETTMPQAGNAMAQQQRNRYCPATDVVAGTARDFEVVQESDCWPHNDGRANPPPDVLRHCQALQFKVDVVEQIWPLKDWRDAERVRTFRLSGVSDRVQTLRKELAPEGKGPQVFYARASAELPGVLRNTQRGRMLTDPVSPAGVWATRSQQAARGALPRLADAVRYACRWDHAFVGTATALTITPLPTRPPQPDNGNSIRAILEFTLRSTSSLDETRPFRPGEWKIRFEAEGPADALRERWMGTGPSAQFAVLAQEDRKEPGLLRLLPRNPGEAPQYLSVGQIKDQIDEAKGVVRTCSQARAEYVAAGGP